jgi:hypothetical protein
MMQKKLLGSELKIANRIQNKAKQIFRQIEGNKRGLEKGSETNPISLRKKPK